MTKKNNSSKMTIAIIGGGEAATKAISAIQDLPLFDIRNVVCQPEELCGLIKSSHRVSNIADVLINPDIEAIYIATPNNTHIPIAIDNILAGKHTLIEKPLSLSIHDGIPILDYENKGPVIAVAFKKRFTVGIQYFYELSDKYQLTTNVNFLWHITPPPLSWRHDLGKSGGGVIMDLGSHAFDILEYHFGNIHQVSAKIQMCKDAEDIDEEAHISLLFESGREGTISLSWRAIERRLEISTYVGKDKVVYERIANSYDIVRSYISGSSTKKLFDPKSEYWGLFKEFYQAVRFNSGLVPTIKDGLRNQIIIDAVYQSAQTNNPVTIR